MSTEQSAEKEPQKRTLTGADRINALVEIHTLFSEIPPPKSLTLAQVYQEGLTLLGEIVNSLIAELQEAQKSEEKK